MSQNTKDSRFEVQIFVIQIKLTNLQQKLSYKNTQFVLKNQNEVFYISFSYIKDNKEGYRKKSGKK